MWSHDEKKEITKIEFATAVVRCSYCGSLVRKYVESHYTGGSPCALLARYCRYCSGYLKH